ncbi:MAG: anaerobic ribonucleoside-triphosphate reductase activating protein [Clostridia bacterium]|nr:anaerobic ribonucleoside-triphosphate reductase activating protein [Clostridia bacterium]MBP3706908.1 anaerobic ribonucleoside-triphosphate reductase activating protein [Clostridia bacterium]
MKIAGLQKLTLLDYPEKIACIVFTAGCNFRCPFCHNASLVLGGELEDISEEDFFAFLEKRQGMLNGVCVTGGEPTLQRDLLPFLKRVKEMGYSVKLDTNGYNPRILKKAVNEGLVDYVAMDIKNSPEKYALTIGTKNSDFSQIQDSIHFLISANIDYEFRTTVVKELHTPQDIVDITKLIAGAKRYFLQTFKDSGDLIQSGFSGYDEISMKNLLNLAKDSLKAAELRG